MFELAHAPWLAPALQLVGSAFGVVLLVGYTHLLWGRRPHVRLTADAALERFGGDYPDEHPIAALVLDDGRTALVQVEAPDGVGVVSAHGLAGPPACCIPPTSPRSGVTAPTYG